MESGFGSVLRLLVTLSGGAVVLVATFLRDIFPKPSAGLVLAVALACFTLCVVLSITGLFALAFQSTLRAGLDKVFGAELRNVETTAKVDLLIETQAAKQAAKWAGTKFVYVGAPAPFVLGIVSLAVFVLWNLLWPS